MSTRRTHTGGSPHSSPHVNAFVQHSGNRLTCDDSNDDAIQQVSSPLQRKLDSWTQELEKLEKDQEQHQQRRRSLSNNIQMNFTGNESEFNGEDGGMVIRDEDDGEDGDSFDSNASFSPPSTSHSHGAPPPTALSSTQRLPPPPPTAIADGTHKSRSSSKQSQTSLTQGALTLGLAHAALEAMADGNTERERYGHSRSNSQFDSSNGSPLITSNGRTYIEQENMLRLERPDDEEEMSSGERRVNHKPVNDEESAQHRRRHHRRRSSSDQPQNQRHHQPSNPSDLHLPLDTLTLPSDMGSPPTSCERIAPPPTAAQPASRPITSSNHHHSSSHHSSSNSLSHISPIASIHQAAAAQVRPPSGANFNSNSIVGLGSLLPLQLDTLHIQPTGSSSTGSKGPSRRRSLNSGTILPQLDPAALRSGQQNGSVPRTPTSGEHSGKHGSGFGSGSGKRSQAGSGTSTPKLLVRRQPTNSQLPALNHTYPPLDDETHTTADLASLSASNPTPVTNDFVPSTRPERTSLSTLAAARADRRRTLPTMPNFNDHPTSGTRLNPLQSRSHMVNEDTADSGDQMNTNPIVSRRSDSGEFHTSTSSTLGLSGSRSRQRPTTPYSNSAAFEAISKRRSLPPVGLSTMMENSGEKLHAEAK